MKWKIQLFIPLVFLLLLIGVCNPMPAQGYTYDSFSPRTGDEYDYIVTVSENPNTNALLKQLVIYPFANAVGDQIRIQIQKANTTKLPTIKYDTLYGRLQNSSVSSSVWDAMTSNYTLLGAFNRTVEWLVNPWSLFIIPRNTTAVHGVLYQLLTTYWNFTSVWTSAYYYGEWSGWNGSMSGDLNQPRMSFQFSYEGTLLLWQIYNGTGLGWNLIYSLEMIPEKLVPQANDELVWKVTVSENSHINPLAPNVGDQMKIKVLVNNWTFAPPTVYHTLYGLVFNCSATNQTWVPLTETLSLIGSFSYADGIIINEWNPYLVPYDYAGVGEIIGVLLPYPPYSNRGGSSSGTFDGYNGSQTGDFGAIKTLYQFSTTGILLYWRFYTGTGDGWHLVYSLDLQINIIPGYDIAYVFLGLLAAVFLFLLANDRWSRKLTLNL